MRPAAPGGDGPVWRPAPPRSRPNPTGIDFDFTGDGNPDQDDIQALINTIGDGGCP